MGTQIWKVLQPSMLCFCLKTNSDSTWWLGCGKWPLTLLALRGSKSTNLRASASPHWGDVLAGGTALGCRLLLPSHTVHEQSRRLEQDVAVL